MADNEDSGSSAILGVIVGAILVGAVVLLVMNGTFTSEPDSVEVEVEAPASPPELPTPEPNEG